jgi:hypothetical protein
MALARTTFASSLDINQQCRRAKKELNLREVPQLPTIRPRSLDTAQPCLIIVLAANTGDVVLPLGEHMLIEMLIDKCIPHDEGTKETGGTFQSKTD